MGCYLRLKFRVLVVVESAGMQFSNFKIEHLRKKNCKTVLACLYGAQVESF